MKQLLFNLVGRIFFNKAYSRIMYLQYRESVRVKTHYDMFCERRDAKNPTMLTNKKK